MGMVEAEQPVLAQGEEAPRQALGGPEALGLRVWAEGPRAVSPAAGAPVAALVVGALPQQAGAQARWAPEPLPVVSPP